MLIYLATITRTHSDHICKNLPNVNVLYGNYTRPEFCMLTNLGGMGPGCEPLEGRVAGEYEHESAFDTYRCDICMDD
jgi:hypothetical protein